MVKNVTFAFENTYRNLQLSYLQSGVAINERAWRAMARLLFSNTNLGNQLLFAGLAVVALAGFLILKHALQADATTPLDSHTLNLSTIHKSSADSSTLGTESASNNSQASSSSNTTLKVNGENIPLPQNGAVNRTITDENGTTTTINAQRSESSSSSNSAGQASNSSSSSVQVNVNSTSGGGL